MSPTRRTFLSTAALTVAAGTARGRSAPPDAEARAAGQAACLVDTTLCVGCRKCEEACNRANGLPRPTVPFSDPAPLRSPRRPDADAFTVVNEFIGPPSPDQLHRRSTTVKIQCMHCLEPACVSACIVGALTRADHGAVVYDPSICIGCRYCMVACPFGVPAYEYDRAVAPRVRKCELCTGHGPDGGPDPACARACPMEAIVFGTRGDLLDLARARIESRPERYLEQVYGEHEVGGTAWMYLVGRSPTEIGLLDMPTAAPPRTTEAIQHGIFNYGAAPLALYGGLGAVMWWVRRRERLHGHDESTVGTGRNEPPEGGGA
jgi:Fe-S-cluster-containing dehydrogenase component